MVAEYGLDVGSRAVHEVAAGAAVDVDVDEAGRDVQPSGVDAFGGGRNHAGGVGAHVLDAARADDQHSIRDEAAIGDDRAVVEDLDVCFTDHSFRSAGAVIL